MGMSKFRDGRVHFITLGKSLCCSHEFCGFCFAQFFFSFSDTFILVYVYF